MLNRKYTALIDRIVAVFQGLVHNYHQMYSFQQTKSKKILTFAAALSIFFSMFFSSVQLTYAAAPTSEEIKNTIIEKCGAKPPAISKDSKEKHGEEAAYKTLSQACFGTGGYIKGASQTAQRAKRLLDICDDYKFYLQEAGVYSKKGSVNGGDCDVIVANTELWALTEKLGTYPASVSQDPALDCSANADKCDLVKKYINPFITFLAALVGVAVVIAIISGGLRYITAADDPQKVAAARKQIRGAIIALLAFIFLYAAIRWLLPQ